MTCQYLSTVTISKLNNYITTIPESIMENWQKKSKQVYAAIVVVNTRDGLDYIPGINVEVSMPTGSLCAERSAIACAVAKYPYIEYKDFIDFYVKQIYPENKKAEPCGVCREWISKIFRKN